MSLWRAPDYFSRMIGKRSVPVLHRTVTAADGTAPPAANRSDWAVNPGVPTARVFVEATFTGGTNPSAVVRPWLRSPSGDTNGRVGKGNSATISGTDKVAIDVQVDGDDLLMFVESVSGSPTSFSISFYVSWR